MKLDVILLYNPLHQISPIQKTNQSFLLFSSNLGCQKTPSKISTLIAVINYFMVTSCQFQRFQKSFLAHQNTVSSQVSQQFPEEQKTSLLCYSEISGNNLKVGKDHRQFELAGTSNSILRSFMFALMTSFSRSV